MKTTLITALCFLVLSAAAQEGKDTTNIRIGDMKVIMIDEGKDTSDVSYDEPDDDEIRHALTHFAGVDVGMNILIDKNGKMEFTDSTNSWLEQDYARSMSWRFNLFEEKIRIVKDYVGILVGAGFTYNSYGLKKNVDVISDDSLGTYGVLRDPDDADYSKNKLRASYINVPIMLEFNTSSDNEKSFHFAAGFQGGWRMGAVTKQRYERDAEERRLRRSSDFNMTDWTLDLSARIGYRNFTLWANYGLTSLFETDKGPEVYPVSIGVQFVAF
ncbi:MAG: outer membrane beta-barrel protein [Flavobacteriales bacterium]|nr:outer membrane beta-barrel protein [Flavobacteriales bacterium]